MRYPRLEMMRARRQLAENEITAPHRAAAEQAAQMARQERAAREGLERLMRSEIMPHLMKQVASEMGRGLYAEIMKALRGIGATTGTTTITVPTDMLLGADPDSIVARTIKWWKSETAPRMELRAFKGEQEIRNGVTMLEVRLPAMGYRHAVADGL